MSLPRWWSVYQDFDSGTSPGDKSELYLTYKKKWLYKLDSLLANKQMNKAIKLPIDIDYVGGARFTVGSDDFGITDADMF